MWVIEKGARSTGSGYFMFFSGGGKRAMKNGVSPRRGERKGKIMNRLAMMPDLFVIEGTRRQQGR